MTVAQKHRAISPQEKNALSIPRWVALGVPSSSSPKVCTDVREYADVRAKIDRWVTRFVYPWCSASSANTSETALTSPVKKLRSAYIERTEHEHEL